MCGICGILGPTELEAQVTMLKALRHRGPDDEGSLARAYEDGRSVWFGHRRLAILDLTQAAHQPMETPDGRLMVTFNGEIYNYRELKQDLSARGHVFRGTGDTEVLLAAWDEWGPRSVDRLRGMFAFALWDDRSRALFLVRDRMGEKPLYYAMMDGRLLFSSELRALLKSGLVEAVLDPQGLQSYLAFGWAAQPLTMIKGVRSVDAGEIFEFRWNELRRGTKYWDLKNVPTAGADDYHAVIHRTRQALNEAARLCMVSDVPVGVLLSGGVDSTALLALIAENARCRPGTFSVGFGSRDHDLDELPWAAAAANRFGTTHQSVVIGDEDVARYLKVALEATDQPSKDGVNHLLAMHAAAAAGHKVALTGQGADEIFCGYGRHNLFRATRWLAHLELPPGLSHVIDAFLLGLAPSQESVKKLVSLFGPGEPEQLAYAARNMVFTHTEIERLRGAPCTPPSELLPTAGGCTSLDRLYRMEATLQLKNQLLRDGDQMSMACSLELRAPYLDHKLVELVVSVPVSQRLQVGRKKPLLVDAVSDAAVHEAAGRPKIGFEIPLKRWVLGQLATREVDPQRLGLDERALGKYLHLGRAGHQFERYWALLVLHEWMVANGIRAA